MATSYLEPLPPALQDLLALLRERLPAVPLPEADGRSLQAVAADVVAAARAARDLDEAAERAYRDLALAQRDLLKKAARARAYARIFAADDKDLVRALDAIDLGVDEEAKTQPPAPTTTKKKKKARGERASGPSPAPSPAHGPEAHAPTRS